MAKLLRERNELLASQWDPHNNPKATEYDDDSDDDDDDDDDDVDIMFYCDSYLDISLYMIITWLSHDYDHHMIITWTQQHDNNNNNNNNNRNPYLTLFVGRLSYETNEKKLRREFDQYGPIKNIAVIKNLEAKPRG